MTSPGLIEVACEGGSYFMHETAKVSPRASIGKDTKIWGDAQIYDGAQLGVNCVIGAGVHVENDVILGGNSKVQRGVVLYRGIIADEYVFFGPNATTTNDYNPRSFGPWKLTETHIGAGASIGANATLICGKNIGPLALVGAGTVVTRNVEAAEVVAGNPARHIGWADVAGSVVSHEVRIPEEIAAMILNPIDAIKNYLGETR